MAIGSILTKGVRRTGKINNNKNPKLDSPSSDSSKTSSSFKKGSYKRDSDSEATATSFSSWVHDSSSSATSSSSSMEKINRQKKTVDKLNSKKPTAPPSDASPDLQKHAVHKFTRSGSLRSLKIARKKNITSSESKISSNVKDSHSKKATFSSILKDSKFHEQVEPQEGAKESEEVVSPAKLCSYEHCSLHGHHHHHNEPLIKRFSFLKRRSSKDQKIINPQTQAADKQSGKKKEAKVTKKCGKKKDFDFSIEFYAKTRPEPIIEPNCSREDVHLDDIMFGVKGYNENEVRSLHMDGQDRLIANTNGESKKPGIIINNDNPVSMWRLIHRHVESGLIDQQLQDEKQSCFDDDDDVVSQGKEVQKMLAIKMVREAIEKILLPEEDSSEKNKGDDQNEPNEGADDLFGTKKDEPNGWNHVKSNILMRKFITEMENARRKLDPNTRAHVPLVPELELELEPEAEIVSLRSRRSANMKNQNEWMLDYAIQQVVAELAPTQKRKVALLVKSFETITPKIEKEVAI